MNYILYYKNDILGVYTDINLILHFVYNNIKILQQNIVQNTTLQNIVKYYKIDIIDNILINDTYNFDINIYKFKNNENNLLFSNKKNLNNLYNDILNKQKLNNKQNNKVSNKSNNKSNSKSTNKLNNSSNIESNNNELNMFLDFKDNNEIQNKYNKIKERYIIEKKKIDEMKNNLKKEHEKSEELKRKFYVDKKLYYEFKNELKNNNDFIIPKLFKKDYIIFSKLDNENILDTNNELYEYINKSNIYNEDIDIININETNNYNNLFNYNKSEISDN